MNSFDHLPERYQELILQAQELARQDSQSMLDSFRYANDVMKSLPRLLTDLNSALESLSFYGYEVDAILDGGHKAREAIRSIKSQE